MQPSDIDMATVNKIKILINNNRIVEKYYPSRHNNNSTFLIRSKQLSQALGYQSPSFDSVNIDKIVNKKIKAIAIVTGCSQQYVEKIYYQVIGDGEFI